MQIHLAFASRAGPECGGGRSNYRHIGRYLIGAKPLPPPALSLCDPGAPLGCLGAGTHPAMKLAAPLASCSTTKADFYRNPKVVTKAALCRTFIDTRV